MRDHPDETNFKNQSAFDPSLADDHLTVVMALPFEARKPLQSMSKAGIQSVFPAEKPWAQGV